MAGIRNLTGYKWDVKRDQLLNPYGTIFDEELMIEDCPPQRFPHPWKGKYKWPVDIDVTEEESREESEEESEEESKEEEGPGSQAKKEMDLDNGVTRD